MAKRCMGCMQLTDSDSVCRHCGYKEGSTNSIHQLPVGTVVGGQYTVGKVLGQGGFGITYIAWDNVLEMPVAIKEYFPGDNASRDTKVSLEVTGFDSERNKSYQIHKQRFLREADALGKLWEVPQIVKVLRYFEENQTAYIVMEYVQGKNLRQHLEELGRPFTKEELFSLLDAVAEALNHVHGASLVHRDISPDNIMIQPDGSFKLLDFGAVRTVENPDAEGQLDKSTQTILKAGFTPPEQYRNRGALGPWTDVYALSATLYYCLSGKVPPEAVARLIEKTPIDWSVISDLSKEQIQVLEKGMSLHPRERYADAQKLRQALMSSDGPEEDAKRGNSGKKRVPVLFLVLPVLLISIAMVLTMRVFPGDKPQKPVILSTESTEPVLAVTETTESIPMQTAVPLEETLPIPVNLLMGSNLDPESLGCDLTVYYTQRFPYETAFGTNVRRSDIDAVIFLDSLSQAAAHAVDVSQNQDGSVLAWTVSAGTVVKLYFAADGGVWAPESCFGLFAGMIRLKSVSGTFYTAHVTDMQGMFEGCRALEKVDIAGFDTSRVQNMSRMFCGCAELEFLNLEGFNLDQAENIQDIFLECHKLDTSAWES